MTPQEFLDEFGTLAESAEGVPKLRELILELAVRGKLVEQDEADEPASTLLERVEVEKKRLADAGLIRNPSRMPSLNGDETPEVPSNWVATRLGTCIELVSGRHLKTGEYNESGDGFPYLTGPADFGAVHPLPTRWTHEEQALAKEGDILITVKGSGVGKTNIADAPLTAISRQLMAIRPILIDRDFVHLAMVRNYETFQSQRVGIAIPGIGRDDVNHHVLRVPPLAEQHRITADIHSVLNGEA